MKYTMIFTTSARSDIRGIKNYISADNPTAAAKVSARIYKALANIEYNPFIGVSASERFGVETNLQFFVVSPYKYMVFYKTSGQNVYVIRVLDGRSDYLVRLGLRPTTV